MNPIEKMEARRPYFTPNDAKIYETILNEPKLVIDLTTSELAEKCDVSQPALTRFAKSLEYRRYADFRAAMLTWLEETHPEHNLKKETSALLTNLSIHLAELVKNYPKAGFMEIAAMIREADHVLCMACEDLSLNPMYLESLARKKMVNIQSIPLSALNFSVSFLKENDLLIYFSKDGCLPVDSFNCKVLLLTTKESGDISDRVRILRIPSLDDPENPDAISTSLPFYMMTELIAEAL